MRPKRSPSVAASDRGRIFLSRALRECDDTSDLFIALEAAHAFSSPSPSRPSTSRPSTFESEHFRATVMIRFVLTVIALVALTLALLPFQLIGIAFDLRLQRTIPRFYHRTACALIGVRIR